MVVLVNMTTNVAPSHWLLESVTNNSYNSDTSVLKEEETSTT